MELAARKKRFIQSVLLLQIEKSKCKMQLSNMIFAIYTLNLHIYLSDQDLRISSIRFSSSFEKDILLAEERLSFNWATELAPINTEVTR